MPAKYVIHTQPTANRFRPLTRSGVIAWEEGCLRCAVCVKQQCVYGVYDKRGLDADRMADSLDNLCMNCFRCVQNCPKELIHKSLNPEYASMGDDYWRPDIIARLWYQAETGKIPVSGAGYPGPFSGAGFDGMWTDMSEIVRPTRDGIHGREYISTAVDLGATPDHLCFSDSGDLEGEFPEPLQIPLPMIFRLPSFGAYSSKTVTGWAMAAARLNTYLALPLEWARGAPERLCSRLIPVLPEAGGDSGFFPADIMEIPWAAGWRERWDKIKAGNPSVTVSVRLSLTEGMEEKALDLAGSGVRIIHLEGSVNGRIQDNEEMFIRDGIRAVHLALVEKGLRDGCTLLAGGGMAMAEHVAKSLICGADAVYVDFPILIALECRMCGRCGRGLACPVRVGDAGPNWVADRTVNLIGAWHNQLLEVMGAMGIRDARRLRGETGRAMFFDDLDRSVFGEMGKVKEGYELE